MLSYLIGFILNIRHPLISKLALIDRHSNISKKAKVNRFSRILNSTIDKYSYIGPNSRAENCDIGRFSSISWDCCLGLSSHQVTKASTSPIFSERYNGTGTSWVPSEDAPVLRRTIIGNDVWIGANCIILEGVTLNDGAVIGAGSVVTKDVDAYSIVGGIPAKLIRKRFSNEIISALIKKKWWNAREDAIKKNLHLFKNDITSIEDINKIPNGTNQPT